MDGKQNVVTLDAAAFVVAAVHTLLVNACTADACGPVTPGCFNLHGTSIHRPLAFQI